MFTFLSRIKRIWWQAAAAITVNFPFLGYLTFAWCPAPVLNCYACPLAQVACPIGTLQHFLLVGTVPLFVIGVTVFFGALAGRFYCSHLCPFVTLIAGPGYGGMRYVRGQYPHRHAWTLLFMHRI